MGRPTFGGAHLVDFSCDKSGAVTTSAGSAKGSQSSLITGGGCWLCCLLWMCKSSQSEVNHLTTSGFKKSTVWHCKITNLCLLTSCFQMFRTKICHFSAKKNSKLNDQKASEHRSVGTGINHQHLCCSIGNTKDSTIGAKDSLRPDTEDWSCEH